jgi:hypothetical protein
VGTFEVDGRFSCMATKHDQERKIDEALEATFPASDPPAFIASPEPAHPARKKTAQDEDADYGVSPYLAIRH